MRRSDPDWVNAGKVDHGSDVAEGTIQLPKTLRREIDERVVVVGGRANQAPEVQLKSVFKGRLAPTASDVDYARLEVGKYGEAIKVRPLTFGEKAMRLAQRAALPTLALLAALTALAAAIAPCVKTEMGVTTAVLAVPAAVIALVKAAREP
jgi:hypothetical protein